MIFVMRDWYFQLECVASTNQKSFHYFDCSRGQYDFINDQKLFALKKNIADISNKRKKIVESSISSIFLITFFEFFSCNQ